MGCCSSKEAQAEDVPASRPHRVQGGTHVLGSNNPSAAPQNLSPGQIAAKMAEARQQEQQKKAASNKKLLGDASVQRRQERDADAQKQWATYN